jgi:hypothetical protein
VRRRVQKFQRQKGTRPGNQSRQEVWLHEYLCKLVVRFGKEKGMGLTDDTGKASVKATSKAIQSIMDG